MTSQPGESPSHRMDGPCGDDIRMAWPRPGADRRASLRPRPDDVRTTRREERGPRGETPYVAPPFPPGPAYPVSTLR